MKTCKTNFFQIQEHLKKNKNTDQFFKSEFPDCHKYVIQGFRDINQDQGRPKGGLAQLWDKNLIIKLKPIKTENPRFQAQLIEFPSTTILWINIYCPTDPLSVSYNDNELLSLLSEIESRMDQCDYDDVIIGGDLNWDQQWHSGFSQILKSFTERVGLKSVWDKFSVDYTHIHTDLKSTAILDHFLVNQRLLDLITDAGPIHLGDNLSRHSPIMMKLNLGDIPMKRQMKPERRPRKPAWYKAVPEQVNEFTHKLAEKLNNIKQPDTLTCDNPQCDLSCHSQDRDNFLTLL